MFHHEVCHGKLNECREKKSLVDLSRFSCQSFSLFDSIFLTEPRNCFIVILDIRTRPTWRQTLLIICSVRFDLVWQKLFFPRISCDRVRQFWKPASILWHVLKPGLCVGRSCWVWLLLMAVVVERFKQEMDDGQSISGRYLKDKTFTFRVRKPVRVRTALDSPHRHSCQIHSSGNASNFAYGWTVLSNNGKNVDRNKFQMSKKFADNSKMEETDNYSTTK